MSDPPHSAALEGKYEVLEKLHEGGMGAVYKARHRLLEEIRVVKVVRPHMRGDQEFQQRFLREARTSVRLRHANIAQIYDFSLDEEGMGYLVMEYIDGPNLLQVLKATGPLPVEFVVAVGLQATLALDFLHRQNLIHRDISPDNLMLTRDYRDKVTTKLIDLGLARETEVNRGLTQTGVFLGKLSYASPEHFGGPTGKEKLEPRSDVYSLGVVFYQLLTGELPIHGSDFGTMLAGHLFHPPRGFDETDPEHRVPDELRTLVLAMLAKGVDGRPDTTGDVVRALRGLHETLGEPSDQLVEHLLELRPAPRGEAPGSATRDKIGQRFALETTDIPASEASPTVSSDPGKVVPSGESSATGQGKEPKSTVQVIQGLLEVGDLDAAEALLESARAEEPDRDDWKVFEQQIQAVREATASPTRRVSSDRERAQQLRAALEEKIDSARALVDDGELTHAAEVLRAIEPGLGEPGEDGDLAEALEQVRERLANEVAQQQRRRALDVARAEFDRLLDAGDLDGAREHCQRVESSLGADPEIEALRERVATEEARRAEERRNAEEERAAEEARQRDLEAVERQTVAEIEAGRFAEAGRVVAAARSRLGETPRLDELQRHILEAAEEARRAEEDRRRAEEEQRRRKAEEEKQRKAEEERRRAAEKEEQRAEEERRRAEEEKRRAERQRAEEERRRAEEKRRAEEQRAEEKRHRAEEKRRAERKRAEDERRRNEEERRKAKAEARRVASIRPGEAAAELLDAEISAPTAGSRAPSAKGRLPIVAAVAAVALLVAGLAWWLSSDSKSDNVPVVATEGTVLVDAAPWARVLEILDEEGRSLEVPSDGLTPLRFAAESATYRIRFEMANGEVVEKEVGVVGGDTVSLWMASEAPDVDAFLSRIGF